MYYHICINTHSDRSFRTVELDLNDIQQVKNLLAPHIQGLPIIFSNGESIAPADVKNIVVSENIKSANDVIEDIKQERQGRVYVGAAAREPWGWRVPFRGRNITNEVLTDLQMYNNVRGNPLLQTKLSIQKNEAEKKLQISIEKGLELKNTFIVNERDLKNIQKELMEWDTYNHELMLQLFSDARIANEYKNNCPFVDTDHWYNSPPLISVQAMEFKDNIDTRIIKLTSIIERLEFFQDSPISNINRMQGKISRDVFIVHGHDEGTKETVARFLEKLKLNPIILHEQANRGNTLIEKFEEHSDVAFAVVLLTPDDIGYSKDNKDSAKARARQNVVFELGFFIGKLGRENVCALRKGDIETPTDFSGVVYVSMDERDWQILLAKEINVAGIAVDLNNAF